MSNPYLVQVPFCVNGNKNTIQQTRQPTQDPEDATYDIGFPPETMIPTASGGLPPKGLDFNGIFYELSSPVAHYCRGDRIQFDATYAAAIGGYAKGAILASNDYQKDYISLVDNNVADPNGSNTTWAIYAGQGSVPTATSTTTGTVKLVNSLNSNATDAALTAAQGQSLNNTINNFFNKFANSLVTNNGSFSLPLGGSGPTIIVKYGSAAVNGDSNASVNFAAAFPNACLNAQATLNSVTFDPLADAGCGVTWTRTGLTLRNGTANTLNISWFAIGY